jgi:SAM-dependent methyltransferase
VIASVKNAIGHSLRQLIKRKKGIPLIPNESKQELFSHLPLNERKQADATAGQLFSDFHLSDLYENSSADNYRQNLFYLEMLERAFSEADVQITQDIVAADIGPSDWFYVKVLHAAHKWWNSLSGRAVWLTGYEADAFRVYPNGFSRYDFAQSYIQGLEKVQYIPNKFSRQAEKYDLITMLFPFVFIKDHLKWGLPLRRFNPIKLLRDVLDSLKPGGVLIIVNQGEAEHLVQQDMLLSENIRPAAAFQHTSQLYRYKLIRYVLVAIKAI